MRLRTIAGFAALSAWSMACGRNLLVLSEPVEDDTEATSSTSSSASSASSTVASSVVSSSAASGTGGDGGAGGAMGIGGMGGDGGMGGAGGAGGGPVVITIPENAPPTGTFESPPYLMWPSDDGVSVRWETSTPSIGTVHYGLGDTTLAQVSEPAATTVHELRLTGLPSGALHHYQIAFDGYVLPARTFQTAPDPNAGTPFRFLVWGDNQNGPDNFDDLIPHMVAANGAFSLSVGDCVQNGTRGEYRDQLFGPLGPLADHVPFVVASGNHELYSDPGAALFDEYMSQPGDEHCFGLRYGDVYFMIIDTERSISSGSPQYQCIGDALSSAEATSATWRVAAFHKPPRIEWWFGGVAAFPESMEAPWVRNELEPYLESLNVDVVFNGHNHLYAYSPKTLGGISWFTTGGAGGMIDTDFFLWRVGNWDEIETTVHDFHFLTVDVNGDFMTVKAVGNDGSELHSIVVSK